MSAKRERRREVGITRWIEDYGCLYKADDGDWVSFDDIPAPIREVLEGEIVKTRDEVAWHIPEGITVGYDSSLRTLTIWYIPKGADHAEE
jgi:hypothetical protein